jgi:hypothetical protein
MSKSLHPIKHAPPDTFRYEYQKYLEYQKYQLQMNPKTLLAAVWHFHIAPSDFMVLCCHLAFRLPSIK